jgi:hypothetical protein
VAFIHGMAGNSRKRGLSTRGARLRRLRKRLETEKDERLLASIRAQLAALSRGRW